MLNWFRDTRTIWKLMIGFGIVLCLSSSISYESIKKLSDVNDLLNLAYDRDLMGLSEIKEAAASQLKCARLMRNAVIATGDAAAVEKATAQMQAEFVRAHEQLAAADPKFITPEGRAAIGNVKTILAAYEEACGRIVSAAQKGDVALTRAEFKRSSGVSDGVVLAFDRVARSKEVLARKTQAQAAQYYSHARLTILSISAATLVLGFLFALFIANLVSRPLAQAVNVLDGIAHGDLTRSLKFASADEFGTLAKSLTLATAAIRSAMTTARNSARGLTTVSEELARSSGSMAEGNQKTTANLEETSASLQEITATVRQNSENAKQASSLANSACDDAVSGGEVVHAAVQAMQEISKSSRKIADIISSIDEIAFQTNLLAVNASIEAARAGEQGAGFAVVAQEVRALAQRSALAAKEIKSLIHESVGNVDAGSDLVNRSGETLQKIIVSIKRAAGIVADISNACSEQAIGLSQVNIAVTQLNMVALSSSQQSDSLSITADSVAQQAVDLNDALAGFILDETTTPESQPAKPANTSKSLEALKNRVGLSVIAERENTGARIY